jgi:hypothetical protein
MCNALILAQLKLVTYGSSMDWRLCTAALTFGREAPAEPTGPTRPMIAMVARNAIDDNSHMILFMILSFLAYDPQYLCDL